MKGKYLFIISLFVCLTACHGGGDSSAEHAGQRMRLEETNRVSYPGRSIDYKRKFNDNQRKQEAAAQSVGLKSRPKDRETASKMLSELRLVKSCDNYVVDDLTHSVPYLVPGAKKELDAIGEGFAEILQRNNLPHYRFYVTSILRTQDDVRKLQKSGNVNSISNSCHCYGTTFDIAYSRFDKVTDSHDYVVEDNLKLVLGQVLLNEQRAGNIYVKYEWKQCCFHITSRR